VWNSASSAVIISNLRIADARRLWSAAGRAQARRADCHPKID
jgi:hypothetical protein